MSEGALLLAVATLTAALGASWLAHHIPHILPI